MAVESVRLPPAASIPAEASDFTLDESLLRRRRAARSYRLHAVQIPAVRAAGFVILCLMAVLRDAQTDPHFPRPELLQLVAANLAFAALAALAQRLACRRSARAGERLSLALFHLDLPVWLLNLHHLETGNLFFAFLLLVRVVDQIGFGFRRALYFSVVVTLAYLAYAAGVAAWQPARALVADRIGLALMLALLGVYFALVGLVTERLRERTRASMHAARALVESLRQQADALQAQAAELASARRQAEAASVAKSRFLAVTSHELRTPMNGILGALELLLASPLAPPQKQLACTAQDSATALLALIDDVLNLASIEAGELVLQPGPMDLRQLVQQAVSLMQRAACHKPLALRCEVDPRLPDRVWADPARLRQLVMNLLHNAVKFTEQGTVQLQVSVPDTDDTGAGAPLRVQLAVSDTGIGIAPEHMDTLFDAFTQVDGSTTRRHGGNGLGLAIVKELTHLMGGTLQARSRPGAGSEFCVALPLQRVQEVPAATPPSAAPHPAPPAAAAPIRALLVDDDPVNQIVVMALLQQLGCEVDVAGDGDAGHRAAVAGAHDIVFMDCHMPVLDGFEATRRIRGHEAQRGGRRRVIVALTADALSSDRQRCIDCGMDAVLTKPVSGEQLSAAIAQWTGRRTAGAPPV